MKLYTVDFEKGAEATVLFSFGFAVNPWVFEALANYDSLKPGCIPVEASPEEVAHAALAVLARAGIEKRFAAKLVDEARRAPKIVVVAHGDALSFALSTKPTLSNVRRAADKMAQALAKAGSHAAFREIIRASGAEVPDKATYERAAARFVGCARGADVLVAGRVKFMSKKPADGKKSAKAQVEEAFAKHLSGKASADAGKKVGMGAPAGFHRAPEATVGLAALVIAQREIGGMVGAHVHLHGGHLYVSDAAKKWAGRAVDADRLVAETEKATFEGLAAVAAAAGYGTAAAVARIATTTPAELKKDLKKIFSN